LAQAEKEEDYPDIDIPSELDRRLKEYHAVHGRYVPRQYENKFIRQREDGTRVYIYQMVEEAHRIMPDGRKVYEKTGQHREWIMPEAPKRKPKRADIHIIIDTEIFTAMKSLKHAKKRLVIAEVRNALQKNEDIAEYLPKNVGVAISRRIAHLIAMHNVEIVQETKNRKVLREGKYKYVAGR